MRPIPEDDAELRALMGRQAAILHRIEGVTRESELTLPQPKTLTGMVSRPARPQVGAAATEIRGPEPGLDLAGRRSCFPTAGQTQAAVLRGRV